MAGLNTTTSYGFGGSTTTVSGGPVTADIDSIYPNPGQMSDGSENNKVHVEVWREIAGDYYFAVLNATYNGTNWVCSNTGNPAYGMRYRASIGSTLGALEKIWSASTAGNITWTVVDSWGVGTATASGLIGITNTSQPTTSPLVTNSTVNMGGLITQFGQATTVAFDLASATTVTFPTAFPNNCFNVQLTVLNDAQANPWALSAQANTLTTASFKLNVGGAPVGTTGTVMWLAQGN